MTASMPTTWLRWPGSAGYATSEAPLQQMIAIFRGFPSPLFPPLLSAMESPVVLESSCWRSDGAWAAQFGDLGGRGFSASLETARIFLLAHAGVLRDVRTPGEFLLDRVRRIRSPASAVGERVDPASRAILLAISATMVGWSESVVEIRTSCPAIVAVAITSLLYVVASFTPSSGARQEHGQAPAPWICNDASSRLTEGAEAPYQRSRRSVGQVEHFSGVSIVGTV